MSVTSTGGQANGPSGPAAMNDVATHAVFVSAASNLVPGDTNGSLDVFVRSLTGGTTTRVSVASDGSERVGDSGGAILLAEVSGVLDESLVNVDLSEDARFITFVSQAPLVSDDTRPCLLPGATSTVNCPDVYVHDRTIGQTSRLTVGLGGVEADGPSAHPRISRDGRYVAFASTASNLVAGDTNGATDVFRVDRQTGEIRLVSRAPSGLAGNGPSSKPELDSADELVFVSAATDLVTHPDPVGCARPPCERAFFYEGLPNRVTRVPFPPSPFGPTARVIGVDIEGGPSPIAVMVAERFTPLPGPVLVYTYSPLHGAVTGLGPGGGADSLHTLGMVYAFGPYDRGTSRIERVTVVDLVRGTNETLPWTVALGRPQLALEASRLLFTSPDAIIPADTNGVADVYLLDRDPDGDRMPTVWESAFGLDPMVSSGGDDPDGDGVLNFSEYGRGTHPRGGQHRFLAEGSANVVYDVRYTLFNPNPAPATAVVQFIGPNQLVNGHFISLAPFGRAVLSSERDLGGVLIRPPALSFSTTVEADRPLVVDRTMSLDVHGTHTGYASHAETAVDAPSTTWFLAEGATHGGFELFYLLLNASFETATITIDYLRPAPAPPIRKTYTLPPSSRTTLVVEREDPGLVDVDVSARITSDHPILVERAMYRDVASPPQIFGLGHDGYGVTASAPRWFLAEGATGDFFDLYYLVANPSTQNTRIRITYLRLGGTPIVEEYDVPRESRITISVDYANPALANAALSAIVESLDGTGIVVERSMWWPGQGQWQEGHLVAGAITSGRRWALAEGEIGGPRSAETYVLIANVSSTPGTATLTIATGTTSTETTTRTVPLPANSRVNVPMRLFVESGGFSLIVESDGPEIVVERAMYTNANGIVWAGGTAALATRLP